MPEKKPEITLEEIVAIRESLGLTQAQAGKLLGGGPSAYAKYEAGTVRPAAAAANLLRLLKAHPEMLAALRGAEPLPISAGASARSPFEVSGADIESLPREDLPELLRRLLTAEAEVHGLPADGIHVADNTDAPDGGEDGRITWESGPDRTSFLPSRRCQFQLKSGPVQPAQAGREVLGRDGAVKDMVRKFLEDGGHYLMLCAKEHTRKAIEKREERIRDALREAGLSKACDRIRFLDAGQIAGWTNFHPAVAAWVKEQVEPGVPGPFRSWSHWAGRAEHSTPWAEDERLPEFRARLLERARRPRGIMRVVGPYGVGKSRLALQALSPDCAGHSISDFVLYADEAEADPHAVGEVIQRLADAGARAIAVVNRCSPERRRILENMALREGGRLSLVTIDDDEAGTSSGEACLIEVQKPTTAVVEAIIDHRSPGLPIDDRERLVRFSAGVPKIAVLVARAWRGSGSLAQAADDGLVDAVALGRSPRDSDLLRKAAKLLAVFGLIDPRPESGDELGRIAAFGNLESDDLYAALTDLAGRGVVRRRGGLMLFPPSPLSMNLAARQWREWRPSKWDGILAGDIGPDLGLRAAKRLALLNDTDTAKEVVAHACRTNGPLDGILEGSSSGRTALLAPLAEIDAGIVAELLERSLDHLGDGPESRGSWNITQALSRIAFRADTFEAGARLLLRMAARSAQGMTDAARQFISLFPVYLANTAADGKARLRFLDEIIDEDRPDERLILVEALTEGLTTHRFTRGVGDESHGSLPALEPWLPSTHREAREYLSDCMRRLVPFAERDDETGRAARVGLGLRLRGLIDCGLINAVEKATTRIRKTIGCWPEAIGNLNQFLEHDAQAENQALISRVQKLIEKLQPQELEDRGRFLVTAMPRNYLADPKLPRERRRLQVREIEKLAAEFIKHPERLQRFLPEISSGQQRRAFAFGRALANASDSPLDWLEPIASAAAATPAAMRNFDLLHGYLAGAGERQPGAAGDFKQRAARSPELAPALPMICRHCGIEPSDIRLALDALEAGRLHPDYLMAWEYSETFAKIPVAAIIPLFDWLLGHGAEAFRVGICLLGPYAGEDPGNFEDLRPQIRRVAGNATRHGSKADTTILGYHFEKLMRKALKKGWQDAGARAVALALAKALADIEKWRDCELVRPVLPLLLSEFTEIVWPVLGQAIASDPDSGYRFKHVLGCQHSFEKIKRPLILKLPEETLFDWCHEHPDHAPAFTASTVPVLTTYQADATDRALHPVISRLIDEFGEREDVLFEIRISIQQYSWSGPLAKYYGLFLEPLERLRSGHPKNPVRRWAKEMLRFLREQAEAVQRRDEEREARWDV